MPLFIAIIIASVTVSSMGISVLSIRRSKFTFKFTHSYILNKPARS